MAASHRCKSKARSRIETQVPGTKSWSVAYLTHAGKTSDLEWAILKAIPRTRNDEWLPCSGPFGNWSVATH